VAAADRPVRRSWFKADTLTAPFSPTLCNFSLNSTETGKPPEDQHDDEEPRFAEEEPGLLVTMPKRRDKFWYLDVGFRVSHTRLESTNDQINKRLELPQKFDIFGLFNNPYTPLDRKTDGGLATAYIGIGRRETDWLTWNFYLGGGIGGDHNHQRWLNANYNVNFDYAGYYTGVTADIYPWGLPEYRDFSDWKQRLRASRPYLLTGFELGYIRAKGWGNYKLAPLTLYADEVKIRDWLASYLLGIGWELPLNQRWSFMWSGHYSFHFLPPGRVQ